MVLVNDKKPQTPKPKLNYKGGIIMDGIKKSKMNNVIFDINKPTIQLNGKDIYLLHDYKLETKLDKELNVPITTLKIEILIDGKIEFKGDSLFEKL